MRCRGRRVGLQRRPAGRPGASYQRQRERAIRNYAVMDKAARNASKRAHGFAHLLVLVLARLCVISSVSILAPCSSIGLKLAAPLRPMILASSSSLRARAANFAPAPTDFDRQFWTCIQSCMGQVVVKIFLLLALYSLICPTSLNYPLFLLTYSLFTELERGLQPIAGAELPFHQSVQQKGMLSCRDPFFHGGRKPGSQEGYCHFSVSLHSLNAPKKKLSDEEKDSDGPESSCVGASNKPCMFFIHSRLLAQGWLAVNNQRRHPLSGQHVRQ